MEWCMPRKGIMRETSTKNKHRMIANSSNAKSNEIIRYWRSGTKKLRRKLNAVRPCDSNRFVDPFWLFLSTAPSVAMRTFISILKYIYYIFFSFNRATEHGPASNKIFAGRIFQLDFVLDFIYYTLSEFAGFFACIRVNNETTRDVYRAHANDTDKGKK